MSTPVPSILIVDDDPDIREALVDVLSDSGFAVRAAANGREALAILRSSAPPRVVLLDLMMPVMDGLQFRQEQLADPALRDIPVIVISAGSNVAESARALGVTASLRKPLDLDKLLEVIARST